MNLIGRREIGGLRYLALSQKKTQVTLLRRFTQIVARGFGLFGSAARGNRGLMAMKANEFDERFDADQDISAKIDWTKARRLNVHVKRVNLGFPRWVVKGLDRQAQEIGIIPPCLDQDVGR